MSALTDLEAQYDGRIPPSVLAARNETPEHARARRLSNLKDTVDHYGRKLAQLRAAKAGDVIGCVGFTAEMLARETMKLTTQLDRASREYHDFAMSEVDDACHRASGYGHGFDIKQAAE